MEEMIFTKSEAAAKIKEATKNRKILVQQMAILDSMISLYSKYA